MLSSWPTLWMCALAVLGTATFLAALSFFEALNDYRDWRRRRKGKHDDESKSERTHEDR